MALTAIPDNPTPNCSGFSMIEVLITILVFAIGLLGVAAMQVQALKGTSDSGQRGKAVWLAQEITERMRANPVGVQSGDYIITTKNCVAPGNMCSNYFNGSGPVSLAAGVNCTPAQLAAYDIWELTCGTFDPATNNNRKGSAVNFLAGADVSILCTSCAVPGDSDQVVPVNSDFTITVSWTGRGGGDSDVADVATDTMGTQKVELLVRP